MQECAVKILYQLSETLMEKSPGVSVFSFLEMSHLLPVRVPSVLAFPLQQFALNVLNSN